MKVESFRRYIEKHRSDIEKKLLGTHKHNYIKKILLNDFRRIWIRYEKRNEKLSENLLRKIVAIDSGTQSFETRYGSVVYFINACYLKHKTYEFLPDIRIFYEENETIPELVSRLREYNEHKIALKALTNHNDVEYILLDGSIYGRLLHVFKKYNVKGYKKFILEYYNILLKLIKQCLKRDVKIIGISKFSRSSFLLQYFCEKRFLDEIKIYEEDYGRIINIMERFEDFTKVIKELQKILKRGEAVKFLEEYFNLGNDVMMLQTISQSTGYTRPFVLSASRSFKGYYKMYNKNREEFFKNILDLDVIDKEYEKLLESYFNDVPSIVTFYVRIHPLSNILRIDMLYPKEKFLETRRRFVEVDDEIYRVLKIIFSLSSGGVAYNILLNRVDQLSRLSFKDKEKLVKLIENILNMNLHSHGMRRF